jgi:hypothetical protein
MADQKADGLFGDGDPFDDPRWQEADADAKTESSRQAERRKHAGFSYKRLPDLWIERLREARCNATQKLAHHLLELDWRQYGRPFEEGEQITLANSWLADIHVSRRDKGRALRELQDLGLIRVGLRSNKSPIVTLLNPQQQAAKGGK